MMRGTPSSSRCDDSPKSSALVTGGGVVDIVDTGGLDVVLLHELAEVLAVDIRVARGVRDVAAVAPQHLQDVVALERGDPALLRVLERDALAEQLVGRRRRLRSHRGTLRHRLRALLHDLAAAGAGAGGAPARRPLPRTGRP